MRVWKLIELQNKNYLRFVIVAQYDMPLLCLRWGQNTTMNAGCCIEHAHIYILSPIMLTY